MSPSSDRALAQTPPETATPQHNSGLKLLPSRQRTLYVSDAGSENFNLPAGNVQYLLMASVGTRNETLGRP